MTKFHSLIIFNKHSLLQEHRAFMLPLYNVNYTNLSGHHRWRLVHAQRDHRVVVQDQTHGHDVKRPSSRWNSDTRERTLAACSAVSTAHTYIFTSSDYNAALLIQ